MIRASERNAALEKRLIEAAGKGWGETTKVVAMMPFTAALLAMALLLGGSTDIALGDSSTAPTLLYGESISNIPPCRQWSGSIWSAASPSVDFGANPRWTVIRNCPVRNELLGAISDSTNRLKASICNGTSWNAAMTLGTDLGTSTERPFYIAYEQVSGDGLVAYREGAAATLFYRTWNGTTWSAQMNVALPGVGSPTFIKLIPRPGSDEVMAVVLDSAANISALVWNGSAFGNAQLLESNAALSTEEIVDAGYEQVSRRCVIVWGRNGTTSPQQRIWNGTGWLATAALPGIPSGSVGQVKVAADPISDKLIAAFVTSVGSISSAAWNGSGWGPMSTLGSSVSNIDCRSFDVAFEPSGTRALCVFGQGYVANWAHRKQITIDKNLVSGGADLVDFPILIRLTADADLAAKAQSNGNDIFFTSADGTTRLSHEIESYTSSTGALVAWVKAPQVSASVNTVLYMYYGNPSSTNQENRTGVWTNGYNGVWHLNGTAFDSTINANNGTISGATAIAGQFGSALDFNGTTNYVSINNAPSLNPTTSVSLEGWVRMDTFGSGSDVDIVIRKGEENPNKWQLALHDKAGYFYLEGDDNNGNGPKTAILAASTWYYLAATWNGTTERIYLNGTLAASYSKSAPISTDTRKIFIGGRTGSTDVCDGRVDEVRYSSVTRSAGWITTQYNNLNSPATFYSIGTETNLNNLYFCTYDGASWSAPQTGPATASPPSVIQLCPTTSGSETFLAASCADSSLIFARWNGSSLVDTQTHSGNLAGVVRNEAFMFSDFPQRIVRILRWTEVRNKP